LTTKRKWVASIVLCLTFVLNSNYAYGFGPQLQVDCGTWNLLKDAKGAYRELSASAFYEFSGASFTYNIEFYGSTKDVRTDTSRATINWSHEIKNPEYSSRVMEVPITTQFRNNKFTSYMYKTKYIRANILFTDSQGYEARKICIWKWK